MQRGMLSLEGELTPFAHTMILIRIPPFPAPAMHTERKALTSAHKRFPSIVKKQGWIYRMLTRVMDGEG